MQVEAGKLKVITQAALEILAVIKKIVHHYVTVNSQDNLFNQIEWRSFLKLLRCLNEDALLAEFERPFTHYASCSYRPYTSDLYKVRVAYMLTLKKYTNANDLGEITDVGDTFLMKSLSHVIENYLEEFSNPRMAVSEDQWFEIELAFQRHFVKLIQPTSKLNNGSRAFGETFFKPVPFVVDPSYTKTCVSEGPTPVPSPYKVPTNDRSSMETVGNFGEMMSPDIMCSRSSDTVQSMKMTCSSDKKQPNWVGCYDSDSDSEEYVDQLFIN